MSSSDTDIQRLDQLRAGYREAFREWISARNVLRTAGRGADAEEEAQAREVAAALTYRNSRNNLVNAMERAINRWQASPENGAGPSPSPDDTPSNDRNRERREWRRDFLAALAVIGLAVTGGTFLAEWVP
jgi:hypothetical protein